MSHGWRAREPLTAILPRLWGRPSCFITMLAFGRIETAQGTVASGRTIEHLDVLKHLHACLFFRGVTHPEGSRSAAEASRTEGPATCPPTRPSPTRRFWPSPSDDASPPPTRPGSSKRPNKRTESGQIGARLRREGPLLLRPDPVAATIPGRRLEGPPGRPTPPSAFSGVALSPTEPQDIHRGVAGRLYRARAVGHLAQ